MSDIFQIDPNKVAICQWVSFRAIRRTQGYLEKDGQIEPIVLAENNMVCPCDACPTYSACAQVHAARELGWETILVTYKHD
jgi:hypothetical protein